MKLLSALIILILFVTGCNETGTQQTTAEQNHKVDREQLLRDIRILSEDYFEGRKTDTRGGFLGQGYVIGRFSGIGVNSFSTTFTQPFEFVNQRSGEEFSHAANVIGYIEGSANPDEFIVVTAHFDHLGMRNGEIFNGADDNASGVGGLLAAAEWFMHNPPQNSMIFIGFDAEEQGLQGARYFIQNPVVPLESIIMNVNLDMISLNHDNELYAVGTYHYPYLRPLIEQATSDGPVNVLFGHDSPDLPAGEDWTMSSDHGPFHEAGIPFIYFGVEDHPYYHTPDDIFENITPEFYYNAVTTIINVIRSFDEQSDQIKEKSQRF